jgi:hypothetical protein
LPQSEERLSKNQAVRNSADKALQELRQKIHTKKSKNYPITPGKHMNIISVAVEMAKAVESFVEKAKKFFYSVILLGYRCPK